MDLSKPGTNYYKRAFNYSGDYYGTADFLIYGNYTSSLLKGVMKIDAHNVLCIFLVIPADEYAWCFSYYCCVPFSGYFFSNMYLIWWKF